MSERRASLCGLRGVGVDALSIVVGRHLRSQTRPLGLGFALLAQASIERGRRSGATRHDNRLEAADE